MFCMFVSVKYMRSDPFGIYFGVGFDCVLAVSACLVNFFDT